MKKHSNLFVCSFLATFLTMAIHFSVNALGININNEVNIVTHLKLLDSLGPLTEGEFTELQEYFDRERERQKDDKSFLNEYQQAVRERSRYISWIPWLLLGIILVKIKPANYLVLLFVPVLLSLVKVFTPIDLAIYLISLIIGSQIYRLYPIMKNIRRNDV